MTFSIIQKSQLEGAGRIDSEYFQPIYLEAAKKMSEVATLPLDGLVEFIRCGPFGSNLLCDTYIPNGITVIRPFNLVDLNANSGDLVSISSNDSMKRKLHIYKNGDVFFARVGDTRFGIADGFNNDITISPNIIAARVKSSLDPYFLTLYLASKYGFLQVERGLKIVAQPTIQTEDIRNILIPIFGKTIQEKLGNFLKESFALCRESEKFYHQAENLLLDELGLMDFKVPEDLSYVVNYSDTQEVARVDADYFQPKYQVISEKTKTNNAKLLGDLVTLKKGFEPGSEAYQEEGKLFIRVSSLSKFGIENKDQKYLSDELYQKLKSDYQPRVGEILLTKDATPGISYVLKEPVEGIISGGVLRLKLKSDIEPEYLSLCISSMIGQMQVERDAGGSIIVHWKPEQIKNILIPVLPKETQQKIADLVRKSHEARKRSKDLLEEAKKKVEDMIESKN